MVWNISQLPYIGLYWLPEKLLGMYRKRIMWYMEHSTLYHVVGFKFNYLNSYLSHTASQTGVFAKLVQQEHCSAVPLTYWCPFKPGWGWRSPSDCNKWLTDEMLCIPTCWTLLIRIFEVWYVQSKSVVFNVFNAANLLRTLFNIKKIQFCQFWGFFS